MNPDTLNRRRFLAMAGAAAAGAAASPSSGAAEDKTNAFSFCRELPVHKPYDVVVCGGGQESRGGTAGTGG